MSRTRGKPRDETGFSLVEILGSMVLLAVTLMSLLPMTMRVAKLGRQQTDAIQRNAALAGEIQRVQLLDFTSLAAGTTCTDYATAGYPHTTCVTVTVVDSSTKQVSVAVTPYGGGASSTSTAYLSQGSRYNPLDP
jgi:Tfp pilus assembly protein PilV